MLISNRFKFVFVHNPKTAGNSITNSLKSMGAVLPNTHMHASVRDMEIPNGFYKFAFVRNPWDRMVSIYEFSNKKLKESQRRYGDLIGYDELAWGFEKWLTEGKMWEGNYKANVIPPLQQRSQSYYVTDEQGNEVIDFIGRFEYLEEDMKKVIEATGIRSATMPHDNATEHKHYREYYSDKSRKFVEKYFKWEIEKFGYEF